MRIKTMILGPLRTNCYLVYNPDMRETLIIDPAGEPQEIVQTLEAEGLTPVAMLLTHGHHDHIGAVADLQDRYGIACLCHPREQKLLENPAWNMSGVNGRRPFTVVAKPTMAEGQISLIGYDVKVIETPGHTSGGVCYYFPTEQVIFTGDTLFRGTIGRTDLPTGSYEQILHSLREKLMALPDDVIVYPGHGFRSTIGLEKLQNPYVEY